MIARTYAMPFRQQAAPLGINPGPVHCQLGPVSTGEFGLVRQIGAAHLDKPSFAARGLRRALKAEFRGAGRGYIWTLMCTMGIVAVARRPGKSRRDREHPIYPHLLRHRPITRPHGVCTMDITYIPMARGFVYP